MTVSLRTKVGQLAYSLLKVRLPLQILQSANGYYLGTANDAGPVSRESLEYWPSESDAQLALSSGEWTQNEEP